MDNILELDDVIKQSFSQYAGAVIQSRALIDVRDCVKPSARQVYYSLFTDKFTSDKPFKKTLKAIGSAMRFYIHGDASCEGIIMRSGQPFAMRYPLIEIEGSYGTLTETGNWAASRYTSSRLSPIANYLLQDTDKDTIDEWVDNYDDTEQYPRVLSTLGFYNIVNGSTGIAVGLASSVPQFNLSEVNNALIALLQDENVSDEDILCYPDFATGATLINQNEVATSLKNGKGKACVLQATITHDQKENVLIVSDLPYGVYTNTVCGEISKLVAEYPDLGIVNINDLTGEDVCIKIYLSSKVDIDSLINTLYAKTSLQKSYSINMTMLEDGRFPKIYGWREALLAHLKHEKQIYINLYTRELNKLQKRLKIVEGILSAIANINEVIQIIRNSSSTSEASVKLQSFLNIDNEQAKAILDMKLSRLAKLEKDKYDQERKTLIEKIKHLQAILGSEDLLKQEMIKRFQEVSNKFGDARRTKITNKTAAKLNTSNKTKQSPTVTEDVIIVLTGDGYFKSIPVKSYRANKTPNLGMFKTITDKIILAFSNRGKLYRIKADKIKMCGSTDKGTAAGAILQLEQGESILSIISNDDTSNDYVLFATKNGIVKKTKLSDYQGTTQNIKGMKAINVKDNDEIISIAFGTDTQSIMMMTNDGYCVRFPSDDVSYQGKVASGVKGIALRDEDYTVSCILCNEDDSFLVVGRKGNCKLVRSKEFTIQGRGGKGAKVSGEPIAGILQVKSTDSVQLNTISGKMLIKMSAVKEMSKTRYGDILCRQEVMSIQKV